MSDCACVRDQSVVHFPFHDRGCLCQGLYVPKVPVVPPIEWPAMLARHVREYEFRRYFGMIFSSRHDLRRALVRKSVLMHLCFR
jgi:hypothetical protein